MPAESKQKRYICPSSALLLKVRAVAATRISTDLGRPCPRDSMRRRRTSKNFFRCVKSCVKSLLCPVAMVAAGFWLGHVHTLLPQGPVRPWQGALEAWGPLHLNESVSDCPPPVTSQGRIPRFRNVLANTLPTLQGYGLYLDRCSMVLTCVATCAARSGIRSWNFLWSLAIRLLKELSGLRPSPYAQGEFAHVALRKG